MPGSTGYKQLGSCLVLLGVSLMFTALQACDGLAKKIWSPESKEKPLFEAMSVTWGTNLDFEKHFLESFGEQNGVKTQFVPNSRLVVYQQLLRARSPKPDLLELDIVWPSILADDLVDLKPYLKDDKAFSPSLLASYTVRGRLVALPVYTDAGVLYYRPELLKKYGFAQPPATWDDLERMATRIQAGERRAGNKDFWGYTWQGSATEGGTCNALEWQSSAGAGNFIEPSGEIHVTSPLFANALRRATNWIGVISPPAEYVYREDDSVNLWDAGQAAFMRNWASGYNLLNSHPGKDRGHFAVAALPAGPGGHSGTSGGLGMAVSKYAANRELAIKAVLAMTSEANDFDRVVRIGNIPTRLALMQRPDLKARSLLLAVSAEVMAGSVTRPSIQLSEKYPAASLQYAEAVNTVLRRKATPEAAMEALERSLIKLTGMPAQKD